MKARHAMGCDCRVCEERQYVFDATVGFVALCIFALGFMSAVRAGLFSWIKF